MGAVDKSRSIQNVRFEKRFRIECFRIREKNTRIQLSTLVLGKIFLIILQLSSTRSIDCDENERYCRGDVT